MDCECLPDCAFFNDRMKNMPSMSEVLKQEYCRHDWSTCARCLIVKELGREAVPADLFPDEMQRALEILRAAKN